MHIFGFVARKQGFIADLREFGGNLDNFVHSQVKRWGDASLVFRINALSTDNSAAGENLAIPGACFVAAKQVGERTPTVDNQKIWSFFFRVFQSIQHTAVGLAASQKFGGYSVQHGKHAHSVSFQG